MKSIASPDSLGAVISICPLREESPQAQSRHGYSGEFQTILDGFAEEDYFEEVTHTTTEKKRRLTSDQVKALEKNFEVENKLEPERKSKLAEELGLQPRQVAIWFQNRRARWKTKQLEKDYGVLKANYDALKHDYSTLELEKEALAAKLKELKSKLKEEYAERQERQIFSQENKDQGFRIGKEESNMNGKPQKLMLPASSSSLYFNGSSSSSHSWMEQLPLPNSRMILGNPNHPHLVKMEEQSVFAAEESCNFFSVDQAPSLQWYFTGQ